MPLGERPRTVAFGSNRELNVLDVKCMLDIERYRRVNVDATSPDTSIDDASLLRPEHNADFLKQCVDQFPEVNFADQATGRVYLRFESAARPSGAIATRSCSPSRARRRAPASRRRPARIAAYLDCAALDSRWRNRRPGLGIRALISGDAIGRRANGMATLGATAGNRAPGGIVLAAELG